MYGEALATANTWHTRLETFRTAPLLYMTRLKLAAFAAALADVRKYVIAADPDRVYVNFDFKDQPRGSLEFLEEGAQ